MSERLKVLVCGSRSITDRSAVAYAMHNAPLSYAEILHGGARGVDLSADWIAKNSNIPVRIFLPDWQEHGKAAGIIRNREMVEEADAVIAVWDGKSRGTKYTIDYAKEQGKPVYIYKARARHILEIEEDGRKGTGEDF